MTNDFLTGFLIGAVLIFSATLLVILARGDSGDGGVHIRHRPLLPITPLELTRN